MSEYLVELKGDCREVYIVNASSEQEARDNWMNGSHLLIEAEGMEVLSVRLDS